MNEKPKKQLEVMDQIQKTVKKTQDNLDFEDDHSAEITLDFSDFLK